MRLMLEIVRSPTGRLEGTVQRGQQQDRTGFSGTLELLKVLESELERPAPRIANAEEDR